MPPQTPLKPLASPSTILGHHLRPSGALERLQDASTDSIDRHPAAVYLAKLARTSLPTMRHALSVIARILSGGTQSALSIDWASIRYQHTAAVRAALAEHYSPLSVNKMLCALRGVLTEAWRLGLMSAEDYHRARDVQAIRAEVLPAGRSLGAGELRSLLERCFLDKSPAGVRDGAMFALLYGAGLRRSELVALTLEDYQAASGALTVRSGKGRKDRICYVKHGAARALQAWLAVRGMESGPLFVAISRARRLVMRRLSGQAVLYVLRRRSMQAGLFACSPHDFRRTFIGDLLDAGADIATVQRMAGHASVQTTARYDRRGEASKQKAAELLYVPSFI